MQKQSDAYLAFLGLALLRFGTGCGGSTLSCEGLPSPTVLDVVLTLASVSAGFEVTVVAAFERAVFDNGEFLVADENVVVKDAATAAGSDSLTAFAAPVRPRGGVDR